MVEDDLGREAAEDERHGEAEEDEAVVAQEAGVGREEPGADGERIHQHGRPVEEDGQDRQVRAAPRFHHVPHAFGEVGDEEGEEERRDPTVTEGQVVEELLVADHVGDAEGPDLRAVVARDDHDGAGEDEALGRAVEVAEVEGVRVVGFPGREEHGEAGHEGGEGAGFGGTETHGGGFAETGERTV